LINQTAFYCKVKEGTDESRSIPCEKIVVQQVLNQINNSDEDDEVGYGFSVMPMSIGSTMLVRNHSSNVMMCAANVEEEEEYAYECCEGEPQSYGNQNESYEERRAKRAAASAAAEQGASESAAAEQGASESAAASEPASAASDASAASEPDTNGRAKNEIKGGYKRKSKRTDKTKRRGKSKRRGKTRRYSGY
jgi:hypothetical protein